MIIMFRIYISNFKLLTFIYFITKLIIFISTVFY